MIIGVDFHPEFQQTALSDTETGELQEKRLAHRAEAETFLSGAGDRVLMRLHGCRDHVVEPLYLLIDRRPRAIRVHAPLNPIFMSMGGPQAYA